MTGPVLLPPRPWQNVFRLSKGFQRTRIIYSSGWTRTDSLIPRTVSPSRYQSRSPRTVDWVPLPVPTVAMLVLSVSLSRAELFTVMETTELEDVFTNHIRSLDIWEPSCRVLNCCRQFKHRPRSRHPTAVCRLGCCLHMMPQIIDSLGTQARCT